MAAFKNIDGEKAYIVSVIDGDATLNLCGTYGNPEEMYKKLFCLGTVNLTLDNFAKTMLDACVYTVQIKLPADSAFDLPDWE